MTVNKELRARLAQVTYYVDWDHFDAKCSYSTLVVSLGKCLLLNVLCTQTDHLVCETECTKTAIIKVDLKFSLLSPDRMLHPRQDLTTKSATAQHNSQLISTTDCLVTYCNNYENHSVSRAPPPPPPTPKNKEYICLSAVE
jgi:hypothetical protein